MRMVEEEEWKVAKRGITGLETAIVLIAFVIVASVFAFAVLNMGLLSTQRASETAESGMKQAASALQLAGSVIAYDKLPAGSPDDKADLIEIYIKLAPGYEAIDLTKEAFTIRYMNPRLSTDNVYDNATNGKAQVFIFTGDGDGLLERGEVAVVILNLTAIDNEYEPDAQLSRNEWFKVELVPPVGATLRIDRTMPADIEGVMDLG